MNRGSEPYSTSPTVRSGYVAAKSALIGPPSDAPTTTARRDDAASMTARTSSIRVSRSAIPRTRSESPVPRLSKMMNRENDASRPKKAARGGSCHISSTLETAPGT